MAFFQRTPWVSLNIDDYPVFGQPSRPSYSWTQMPTTDRVITYNAVRRLLSEKDTSGILEVVSLTTTDAAETGVGVDDIFSSAISHLPVTDTLKFYVPSETEVRTFLNSRLSILPKKNSATPSSRPPMWEVRGSIPQGSYPKTLSAGVFSKRVDPSDTAVNALLNRGKVRYLVVQADIEFETLGMAAAFAACAGVFAFLARTGQIDVPDFYKKKRMVPATLFGAYHALDWLTTTYGLKSTRGAAVPVFEERTFREDPW